VSIVDNIYSRQHLLFLLESEKDTKEEELLEVTFKPKLCTFEQEIMVELDIKDDRKPAKSYWY